MYRILNRLAVIAFSVHVLIYTLCKLENTERLLMITLIQVKTGMLPSTGIIQVIRQRLKEFPVQGIKYFSKLLVHFFDLIIVF